ncbi:MAG: hypothetical protein KIT83_00665 [Bryobacterales bacterium]|nr:hypothetical protein [Bryobacterales bacterium]
MFRDAGFVVPFAVLLLVGMAQPGMAASAFDRLVNALEDKLGVERERIPAGWLVNTVLFVARPAGVKHLEIATYPDVRLRNEDLAGAFQHAVGDLLEAGWHQWVWTRSNRGGEWTTMYVKPAGRNWEILLATVQHDEAKVIRMKVDAKTMARYLQDHHSVDRPNGD